ncbi:MAG TPA: hypothetical protein VJ840_08320 [Gemmatimonadaceae bacterium]|nr:hypothetical protein [Gemmatimonadaceae bacterium]
MKSLKSKLSVLLVFAAVGMTACGSDSTGPSNLDAVSALKSLALGLDEVGGTGTTAALNTDASFGGIAPFLDQVTVDIGGSTQTMFALALHVSFPDGTCWETIFGNVIPADPGACTPPPLGLMVMLWQSHSAAERPDRMAFIAGDVGTSDFSFDIESPELPAVAMYVEGEDDLWLSESGTLTSAVSATQQDCNVPLPLFAKSGHCNIATFAEQGSIVLTAFDDAYGYSTTAPTKTLTIPPQSLHGLWMAITEVQPIGLTASRALPLAHGLLQRVRAR